MNRLNQTAANIVSAWIVLVVAVPIAIIVVCVVAGVLGVIGCSVFLIGVVCLVINSKTEDKRYQAEKAMRPTLAQQRQALNERIADEAAERALATHRTDGV
jgi:hypothetical protein